jgi:hypothetical protein
MRPDGTEIAAVRPIVPSDVPPPPAPVAGQVAAHVAIPRPGALRFDAPGSPAPAPTDPTPAQADPIEVDVVTADAVQRRVTKADVAVFLEAVAAPRPTSFGAILDDSLLLG